MCHSRTLNAKINKIHERALRIVFNDNNSPFDALIQKAGTVKIHHRNLQILAVEIYKALHTYSPFLMSELFKLRDIDYNLCGGKRLNSTNIKTVYYGTETISHLPPKIWEQVPEDIKDSSSLDIFKRKIKSWIPNSCPCKICKLYIPDIGHV